MVDLSNIARTHFIKNFSPTPLPNPQKAVILSEYERERLHIASLWGRSSVGRAFGSHPRGRGFKPLRLHHFCKCFILLYQ